MKKKDRKQKHRSELQGELITLALKLLGKLPMPVVYGIGEASGRVLWLMNTDARKVTETNIDICFADKPETWRKQLAKRSLIETAKTACEMGAVWVKPPESPLSRVRETEGVETIQEAIKNGKGVIVLAPHLGNWEILGNFLCERFPITNLYQPPKYEALHKLIYHARTRSGAKLAPTTRRGVVQLVKALRNGEVTGILPDQEPDRGSGGDWIPFFGKKALTATIIPRLAKETNALVVGGFCLRDGNGGYKMIFRPVDDGIYSPDLAEATAAMNRAIEQFVLECPEQYQWEYKRFKRRPKGEPKVYNPVRLPD